MAFFASRLVLWHILVNESKVVIYPGLASDGFGFHPLGGMRLGCGQVDLDEVVKCVVLAWLLRVYNLVKSIDHSLWRHERKDRILRCIELSTCIICIVVKGWYMRCCWKSVQTILNSSGMRR